MCGECYFQMGLFDKALQHYTNALELFQRFSDWMTHLQFPAAIPAAGAGAKGRPLGCQQPSIHAGFYTKKAC